MSTMARLAKKKLLRVEKCDQAYIYYPTYTQQAFISHVVGRILEDLFVSFSGEMLAGTLTIQDPQVIQRARQLHAEIAHRLSQEEAE